MKQRGFTVIELLAMIVLLIIIGAVFWTQKTNIETAARDDRRKTSINAVYYTLEEVFYKTNGYYPKTISAAVLPSVDKNLFTDPDGVMLGQSNSDFRYEPKNCVDDKCKGYTLRSYLENEADFVKNSRSN